MDNFNTRRDVTGSDEGLRAFFQRMYTYMTIALGVTAITGWIVEAFFLSAVNRLLAGNFIGLIVIIAAEFAIIYGIQRASAENPGRAFGLMMLFSVIQGLFLGSILAVYTHASVLSAFLSTAAIFGSMAAYGYFTKRSLAGLGPILFGGLIALIVASVLNIFIASSLWSFVVSLIAVVLFALYTAYDNNQLKALYAQLSAEGQEDMTGLAIIGALTLYLDFINMFYALIRLTGDSNN
ncbi:Bax inhibitor-1/YccA family protein [Leuconostocaceae bacterium ESL0723]|nr:Bax inhibitor-1/YccA family protein [Leuconostocaceae bacterium ESL0723]